jgi:hypothetical protein
LWHSSTPLDSARGHAGRLAHGVEARLGPRPVSVAGELQIQGAGLAHLLDEVHRPAVRLAGAGPRPHLQPRVDDRPVLPHVLQLELVIAPTQFGGPDQPRRTVVVLRDFAAVGTIQRDGEPSGEAGQGQTVWEPPPQVALGDGVQGHASIAHPAKTTT